MQERAAYAANLTVVLSVILKVADFIVALRTTARLPRFTLPVEAFTSPDISKSIKNCFKIIIIVYPYAYVNDFFVILKQIL